MLTLADIRNLLNENRKAVFSLYLHVDPAYQANQSDNPAWQIYVKNALRDIETSLDDDTDINWNMIRTQVEVFFESFVPNGKTLVLFINQDGVIERYNMPTVTENHHAFGAIDVVPLLWALDEYERYLVVLVDSEQARFLSAYLGEANANEEMHLDFDDYDFGNKRFIYANHATGGEGQHSSGGENFEDMKDEHIRRFHSDVAEQIRQLMEEMHSERIILGGSEQAAHQVQRLLHGKIQNQVVDILSIPIQSKESDVAVAIQSRAIDYERAYELNLVNDVIDLAKSGGRGALGIADILNALELQQVELLVLPYPMEDSDLASKLSLMALENGAAIELVHGSAASRLKQEGEVAARLFYRVNEAVN